MCGRFSVVAKAEKLEERFNAVFEKQPDAPPMPDLGIYNAAPSMELPIVMPSGQIKFCQWGLHTVGHAVGKGGYATINARIETLAEKPTFSPLVNTYRCIVPANSYYEWRTYAKNKKQAYRIYSRTQPILGLAGLYAIHYPNQHSAGVASFTIITQAAQGPAAQLHHRMPVALHPKHEALWLNTNNAFASLKPTVQQHSLTQWHYYAVHNKVGSPHHNTPDLWAEAPDPGPGQLSLF